MKREIWTRHRIRPFDLAQSRLGGIVCSIIIICTLTGFARAQNWSVIPSDQSSQNGSDYRQGELLVRFIDSQVQAQMVSGSGAQQLSGPQTTTSARSSIADSIVSGAVVTKEYDRAVPGLSLVKLPPAVAVLDAAIRFNQSPYVLYAQPNYKIRAMVVPNDPLFIQQWGLNNNGQMGGLRDADIDAPEAWDIETGSADIVVAVLDSGIDYTHPDLVDNMWINEGEVNEPGVVDEDIDYNDVDDDGNGYIDDIYGYDFVDNDFDPMDEQFHGTHVAGIIGAVGNNGLGIAGVCWDVSLMALRMLDENGNGVTSDAIGAINYAISWNVDVINASWGGYFYNMALYDTIAAADEAGILFVAAAGNDGFGMAAYPAGFDLDNIISVMATNQFDNMWGFSNYSLRDVDLGAPGVGIFSTTPVEETDWMDGNDISTDYDFASGTSSAAPHVTGACALMKVVNPDLTYTQIKQIILRSVDPTLPGLCVSGGRLNLYNALHLALKGTVLNTRTSRRYPTIQEAIDGALNGDTLVADSDFWYIETINFNGKAVTVRSGDVEGGGRTHGLPSRQNTFISALFDGGSVVTFNTGEGSDSVLLGFTIVDGVEGIYIQDSSPTINDCNVTLNSNHGVYCNNSSPALLDSIIAANRTRQNGGGIYCNNDSDPNISNCQIMGNRADGGGGGIYLDNGSDPNITDSEMATNTAEGNGGGIYSGGNSNPNIIKCTIRGNAAEWSGGGIYTVNCTPFVSDCLITSNRSAWDGGGVYSDTGSIPSIMNTTVNSNIADYDGGGIYCNGTSIPIKNCLITDNAVVSWDGGGVFCSDASPAISNCTFAGNGANLFDGLGGAVYCSGTSTPQITNCIFSDNNDVAIYEQEPSSEPIVNFCLFYDNPRGDYYDRDRNRIYNFTNTAPDSVLTGSNNLAGNPMFVPGRLGNFYLSQYEAGQILDANGQFVDPNVNPQDATSPAVDAGSDDAMALGLHIYSTRTDNYEDVGGDKDLGRVDIGYHYNDLQPATQYALNTIVIPAGAAVVSLEPAVSQNVYTQYSQVALIAIPNDPNIYQFKSWGGTDEDTRIDRTSTSQIAPVQINVVTMDMSKTVTINFETILVTLRTRVIAGNGTVTPRTGQYTRDTVVDITAIPTNPAHYIKWDGSDNDYSYQRGNTVTMSEPFVLDPQGREFKEVEVRFYAPRTIDVPGDHLRIYLALEDANNGDIIQIAPGTYSYETNQHPNGDEISIYKNVTITSVNPDDPCTVAATVIEGRFLIYSSVQRDTIINGLTIRNPTLVRWFSTTPDGSGMDGYPAGCYDGGGMELLGDASPDVRNCRFEGCYVWGSNGTDGNGGVDDRGSPGNGGWAGWAHGGAVSIGYSGRPIFTNCSFIDCWARGGDAGDGADNPGGHGGTWAEEMWPEDSWIWDWGPFQPYWKYSGYGGAVYCYPYSVPEFVDCNFINNRTYGGSCGISGQPYSSTWPLNHYKIDSFGGAVYAAEGSSPLFTGCVFRGNEADANGSDWHEGYDDAVTSLSYDPYHSYGGAIAAEDGAVLTFKSCTFNNNLATIGGGMWTNWTEQDISDCNFEANTAYHGGGVYFVGNSFKITQSNFYDNIALSDTSIADPNVPEEVLGEGGAIHCFDANATVVDCNIFNNEAAASGGGIYITGSNKARLQNCLIRDNSAGRDGGGISANWYSESKIAGCTITDNRVAAKGFGGGLYCSYGSYANIINSIIWGNNADLGAEGSQLAIATDFKYDARPSTIDVTYSDIQGATDPNAFGAKTEALDFVFCIDTTGSMYDDIDAVKDAAREITGSIAEKIPDYRIAVVEYKDFNQPNIDPDVAAPYGDVSDYPYRTVLGFTTDIDDVVDALDSLIASGGADWPESVYTALMHCIDHDSLAETLAGQLYGADPDSLGPGAWRPGNVARMILLMADAPPHDPEPFTNYTLEDIIEAAGGNEPKRIVSLLIGRDTDAARYLDDLSSETGGAVLTAATASEVVQALMEAVELISRVPDPLYVGNNYISNWDPDTYTWDPNSHNIDEDPLFVAGYYLSQVAAGQLVDSPAVNTGSDLASVLGMDTYTTRTDSVPDSGIVDMGYHYNSFTIPRYELTFTSIGVNVIEPDIYNPSYDGFYNWYTTVRLIVDSNSYDSSRYQILWTGTDDDSLTGPTNTVIMDGDKVVTARLVQTKYDLTIAVDGGNGRLSARWLEDGVTRTIMAPATDAIKLGTAVQLIAEPAEGYRVRKWIGTDNDASRAPENTLSVYSDRNVRVGFGPPVTLTVPRDYPTIQNAINAAETGDTIVVYPGIYYGPQIELNKLVTIMSEHPGDPYCVAETIIDRTGYLDRAFIITTGANGAVLDGLTIQNCNWNGGNAIGGVRQDVNHPDGYDGGVAEGAAIYINANVNCTVKNCVFRNNFIGGGNGGVGENATDNEHAGRGGWGGWAYGGAIFCGPASTIKFINCQIVNNTAIGGNGGNGGDYQANGGTANYGGNWSSSRAAYYDSSSLQTILVTGNLWQYWGYVGDYRIYSGYGGGVYCSEDSTVDFTACTLSGNIAQGGMSGEGGDTPGEDPEPEFSYEIPSYGGGVYCATGSAVTFTDCNVTDNVSAPPVYTTPGDPTSGLRYRLDPYVGHGGGVCAENTASVVFNNCAFNENQASLGGGTYWSNANPVLSDCNIVDNVALTGGGVYLTRSSGEIIQSDLNRNVANGSVGDGGAVYCFDANVLVVDCTVGHNSANGNGGGIYFAGSNTASITNSLIANNTANRSGGGVSVNWFARPVISNCTFVSNLASGTNGQAGSTGFGGGLYCGYESNGEVVDSIFWNNYAYEGKEITVGTSTDFERRPSILAIFHSDVMGGKSGIRVEGGSTLRWLAGNISADPLFVTGLRGDYYLSQTAAGQSRNSPCLNAGSDLAGHLGLARYTTRTDEGPDKGIVDLGYHFTTTTEPCSYCNFFDRATSGLPNGIIDFKDFAIFASHWLETGCSDGDDWCRGADLTLDSSVDRYDLAFFVECWLAQDTTAPFPNPSVWEIEPNLASPTSIRMVAKESLDGWGWDVQYYFERLPLGDPNSGWQNSREWVDGGLELGVRYGYRVKARDELGNETAWSVASYVGTDDVTPPAPAPYIIQPTQGITSTSVLVTSSIASDENGVEYYFKNITIGEHDSGWISEPNFVDTGLKGSTTYGYQVKARDLSARRNETLWSTIVYVTTPAAPDTDPPDPSPMQFDPNGLPREAEGGGGSLDYLATMTAVVATDPSGGVEYYFECLDVPAIWPAGLSSGWITEPTWTVTVGPRGRGYAFRVKARDIYNNETEWSPQRRMISLPFP